jgi:hypothetical protein
MTDLLWFECQKCPEGYTFEELKPQHVDITVKPKKPIETFDFKSKAFAPRWVQTILDEWYNTYNGIEFGIYILAKSETLKACNPLKNNPAAFMEYGAASTCAQTALAFVNKYGIPGLDLCDGFSHTPVSVPLEKIQRSASRMAEAIRIWNEAKQSGNYEELVGFKFLERFDDPDLLIFSGEVKIDIRKRHGGGPPFFAISPINLTAALWVQFAQAITNQTQLKQCAICPSWFAFGTGFGRRKSSHYCSDKCRKAAHRKRIKALEQDI